MSMLFGALGQSQPAATTLTDIYTVPAGKRATITVTACNTSTTTTIRISHAINGASDAQKQYMLYDTNLTSNDAISTIRFTVTAGDVVRAYSNSGNVSFNVHGIEEDI